jgi:hypothetical protein
VGDFIYSCQYSDLSKCRACIYTGIHTAEPLAPDPSPFEVEIAIENLKRYKLPGSDGILAELIQAGGEILRSKIHKLRKSIWNKEELPDQWKESIVVRVHKKGDKTDW